MIKLFIATITTTSTIASITAPAIFTKTAISPPSIGISFDRRPSAGYNSNVIPHAALCQHRHSLQLNGEGAGTLSGERTGGINTGGGGTLGLKVSRILNLS